MTTAAGRLAASLSGNRAFITGAGSGLGLELARSLAQEGWSVALCDRDPDRLTEALAQLPGNTQAHAIYPIDVSDERALTAAVADFARAAGGLDLMINNAGVASAGAFEAMPLEDWRWIVDVNLLGVVNGCRASIPHLRRAGGGVIVNIASAAALLAPPRMAAYNATKAAVVSISETLAIELRSDDIRLCVAMPTFFRTRLLDTMRAPADERRMAQRMMDTSQLDAATVANSILEAAARRRLYVVLPGRLRRLWLGKRLFPERFVAALARAYARRAELLRQRPPDGG